MSSSTQPPQLPPAGWYPDPEGVGLRWWDGRNWTEHLHPKGPGSAASRIAHEETAWGGEPGLWRETQVDHRSDEDARLIGTQSGLDWAVSSTVSLEQKWFDIWRGTQTPLGADAVGPGDVRGMVEITGKHGGGFVPVQPRAGEQVTHRVVGRYFLGASGYEAGMKKKGWKQLSAEPGEMESGGLRWWTYIWSYMPETAAAEERRDARFGVFVGIPVIAVVVLLVGWWISGIGSGGDVEVVGQSCTENPDGSVHVQGRLHNEGGSDEIAIVEFSLTLLGGQTETSRPFGGYNVPASETSLVGEDFSVPTGASWVDCSVEVLG